MSYWNNDAKYQKAYHQILDLINTGYDENPEACELFKQFNRFYYDLYNNGLCNFENFYNETLCFCTDIQPFISNDSEAKAFVKTMENLSYSFDDYMKADCDSLEEVDCCECNGSGEVDDEECSECGGEGWYLDEKISEQEEVYSRFVEPLISNCENNTIGSDNVFNCIIEALFKDPKVKAVCS